MLCCVVLPALSCEGYSEGLVNNEACVIGPLSITVKVVSCGLHCVVFSVCVQVRSVMDAGKECVLMRECVSVCFPFTILSILLFEFAATG